MPFPSERGTVRWKLHLEAPPEVVYDALATPSGRARYWAEFSPENGDVITFHVLDHPPFTAKVLRRDPPRSFTLEYFGSPTEFTLTPDGEGGTDLSLVATGVEDASWAETLSGWVSVLMAMKAAVDHGIDLRNHDPERSWQRGFADN